MESWRVRPRCCLSHDHPYAPVAAGLELVLGRTEGEHLALRFVEAGFVDRHIEVALLGTAIFGVAVPGPSVAVVASGRGRAGEPKWSLWPLTIGDRPLRTVDQPSVPRRVTNPTEG